MKKRTGSGENKRSKAKTETKPAENKPAEKPEWNPADKGGPLKPVEPEADPVEVTVEVNEAMDDKEQAEHVDILKNVHKGVLAVLQSKNVDVYKRSQDFNELLDRRPGKRLLRDHPYLTGVKYLPISHIEGLMDTLFFRQWSTYNFRTERVANEVVGTISVSYIDPVTEKTVNREGSAALQIEVHYKTKKQYKEMGEDGKQQYVVNDVYNNKLPDAFIRLYPHLKAQAFKNACASIGAIFGRDMNRDVQHTPKHMIPQNYEAMKQIMNEAKTQGNDSGNPEL